LFELGVWRRLHEFLYQAYAVGFLSLAAAALVNIADQLGGGTYSSVPLAWMALATYAAMARTFLLQQEQVDEIERVAIRRVTSVNAVTYLAAVELALFTARVSRARMAGAGGTPFRVWPSPAIERIPV